MELDLKNMTENWEVWNTVKYFRSDKTKNKEELNL